MKKLKSLLYCLAIILTAAWTGCISEPQQPATTDQETGSYTEAHRPQIHFSPPANWMNDPNGMVYYDGEYHLFYQYYPDSTVWGPMHWGHAVSTDLVHWQHLPIALYPDSLGYIFSGSAVVDRQNTSGLGSADQPPLIAIFTHHDPEGEKAGSNTFQYQSIAYSLDKGRTWTKYEGNPVVPNPGIRDFRDPKVSWHEASGKWVMIFAAKDRVRLYTSPNLIDWTFTSEFGADRGSHGGVWECPDLFPLPVDGDPANTKWVLLLSINPGGINGGSATQYFIGDFDGQTFTLDADFAQALGAPGSEQAVWLDYGRDNYAGVTFSDIPDTDGRRIFMGWMSNWEYANVVPTEVWRSAMTLPRTLELISTPQGPRLRSQVVREVASLEGETITVDSGPETGEQAIEGASVPAKLNLKFAATAQDSTGVAGVKIHNANGEYITIGYEPATERYFIDRRQSGRMDFSDKFASIDYAPRQFAEGPVELVIYLDVASAEIFADNGRTVLTEIFFPSTPFDRISLLAENSQVDWQNIAVTPLRSIWQTARKE